MGKVEGVGTNFRKMGLHDKKKERLGVSEWELVDQ